MQSIYFVATNAGGYSGYAIGNFGTILKNTIEGVVGIDKSASSTKSIKMYPNPTKDKITLESNAISKNTFIVIFDANGQKIVEQQITDFKTQIDISNLPIGIYFIRFHNGETFEVVKIIKESESIRY